MKSALILTLVLFNFLSCKSDVTFPDKPCFLSHQFVTGDSNVEGPGAVSMPLQLGEALNHDKITVGQYEGSYQLYLTNHSVINGGKSGATSTEIADRYLQDPRRFGRSLIIWAGRNNTYQQDQIIADIDRMIEGRDDYLVLEILPGTWVSEAEGSDFANNLAELNMRLAIEHKLHFVPLKEYLQSFALPSDSIYIARGQVPQSLLMPNDSLHMATVGYSHVAERIKESVRICNDNSSKL